MCKITIGEQKINHLFVLDCFLIYNLKRTPTAYQPTLFIATAWQAQLATTLTQRIRAATQ
jgi:hypothetical protein